MTEVSKLPVRLTRDAGSLLLAPGFSCHQVNQQTGSAARPRPGFHRFQNLITMTSGQVSPLCLQPIRRCRVQQNSPSERTL